MVITESSTGTSEISWHTKRQKLYDSGLEELHALLEHEVQAFSAHESAFKGF